MKTIDTERDLQVLDHLLQRASPIVVPAGAQHRLLAVIAQTPQTNVVVPFTPLRRMRTGFMIAMPLAASFLLGILIGQTGAWDNLFSDAASTSTGYVSLDVAPSSGVDDAEDYGESNLT